MHAAHETCAHAAHRSANQPCSDGTHHARVDDRALERKARIRAANGEQTEDETQKELVVDRAFLPLDHDAQRADLRQYRRHQHEQTDVQDEGKEQIVLHAACPFMLRIYML